MNIPQDQVAELKRHFTDLAHAAEGGTEFIKITGLKLPPGCTPSVCDALLCPTAREGYPSRLYYSAQISSREQRNWNANSVHILGRNWHAFSWKTPEGLRLAQMVAAHLKGLR